MGRIVRAALVSLAAGLAGCYEGTSPDLSRYSAVVVSGVDQRGTIGVPLDQPLVARVLDEAGRPAGGVRVRWSADSGGTVVATSDTSDTAGTVSARWAPGLAVGRQHAHLAVVSTGGANPALSAEWSAEADGLRATAIVGGYSSGYCATTLAGATACWNPSSPASKTGPSATSAVFRAEGLVFAQLAANALEMCGRTPAGVVHCWGTAASAVALPVPGGPWADVASHYDASAMCAIDFRAAGYCWGTEAFRPPATTPELVTDSLSFRMLTASALNTCGLATDGAIYCRGQLYFGSTGAQGFRSATLVRVPGPQIYSAFSSGGSTGCGLSVGQPYCWGYVPAPSPVYQPVPVAVQPHTPHGFALNADIGFHGLALIGFNGSGTPSCVGTCEALSRLFAAAPVDAVAFSAFSHCIIARDTHLVLCAEPIFVRAPLLSGDPHGIRPPD